MLLGVFKLSNQTVKIEELSWGNHTMQQRVSLSALREADRPDGGVKEGSESVSAASGPN